MWKRTNELYWPMLKKTLAHYQWMTYWQGRPGYNRWKRITGAQSTRCGHQRRIARCGGRYDPRWSSAAVSEWVTLFSCVLLTVYQILKWNEGVGRPIQTGRQKYNKNTKMSCKTKCHTKWHVHVAPHTIN